ncbi:MAG: glutamate mutase L [Firmicutes bacterium]|nr:glutamate mutase L [Bacillota bacterium]
MLIDALVFEIGSTTTVVNAFDLLNTPNPVFLGSGEAPTTVLEGDVNKGILHALDELKKNLSTNELRARETFATSSAAGGLKMSVHGLVYDMTVKAAKEAALGAGANIKMITSGILDDFDLDRIKNSKLNIVMIAGGVDYGETQTSLKNAEKIASLQLSIPIIYAGNIQNQERVRFFFQKYNQEEYLFISENVYPKIDVLKVDEARKIIQSVFEKHIIHAPGMEKVRDTISSEIMPTPGAVMRATELLHDEIGDVCTFDVGGATTDVHSVASVSKEVEKILISPEPFSKRTVEGDLGVFVNKDNLIELIGIPNLIKDLKIDKASLDTIINHYKPIPNQNQIPLVRRLTEEALKKALTRHVGRFIQLYGSSGRTTFAEGKDLTNVRHLIGTGGALSKIAGGKSLISKVISQADDTLLKPRNDSLVLIDSDYIMASCGVLSMKYQESALKLLIRSLYKE